MNDDPSDKLKKTLTPSELKASANELLSQVSGLADALKAIEDSSVKRALKSLGPSLHVSDVLAETQASIAAMQLDRNQLADTLHQQMVDMEAMRASFSRPAIELQQQLASFQSERASFLETLHHQIVDSQASLHAALTPALELQQQLRKSLEINNTWSDTLRQQELSSQAAFRAFSENVAATQKQLRDSMRFIHAAAFRLPQFRECAALTANMFEAFRLPQDHIKDAFRTLAESMSQMTSPWLDTRRELVSAKAFTTLQDLGQVINAEKAFDDRATELARVALGDWRKPITLSESVAELGARTALYRDRGFDSELTQFPHAAFDQAVTIARIKRPPPKLIITFQSPFAGAVPDEEEGYELRNFAHDYLQRLETQIREFITTRMSARYGTGWAKQRVPPFVYADWVAKRDKHRAYGGADFPFIAFADFTHYEPIIVRKDNWAELFADVFCKKESVIESLQRLYPIRLATMHARPVSQDDLLLLYVEVKRLCDAMRDK